MTDWTTAWQLRDLGVITDPGGNPREELDEFELGERVRDSYISEGWANLFGGEDKVWSYMELMFGLVCKVTAWRGVPFPERWDIQDVATQMDKMRAEK